MKTTKECIEVLERYGIVDIVGDIIHHLEQGEQQIGEARIEERKKAYDELKEIRKRELKQARLDELTRTKSHSSAVHYVTSEDYYDNRMKELTDDK